jgi:hypothetical protein
MHRVVGLASGIYAKTSVRFTENAAAYNNRCDSTPGSIEAMNSVLPLSEYTCTSEGYSSERSFSRLNRGDNTRSRDTRKTCGSTVDADTKLLDPTRGLSGRDSVMTGGIPVPEG